MAEQITLKRKGGIGRNEPLRIVGLVLLIALWIVELKLHRSTEQHVLGLVLILVLVRITVSDLEERRIKNSVTLPASIAALVIGLFHASGLPGQIIAGFGTGLFLTFFAVVSRGGLGMGDAKLGVVLGLFLSKYVIVAMVVGLLASALFSIGVLLLKGLSSGRKTAIPLGPFLALGGVVAFFLGPHLLHHSTLF